jgi:glycine/D-amino acid oxidase-like deaminating enzyme
MVVDRGALAGGTSSAGEGNLLVSDKEPGPELDLAVRSNQLWRELGQRPLGGGSFAELTELEAKGSLVVASGAETLRGLEVLAAEQSGAGVQAISVAADELPDHEPELARGLAGGYRYPQDLQIQPIRATAGLLRLAVAAGARLRFGDEVVGLVRRGDRVVGVRTGDDEISCAAVVNAAGVWAARIAALAGVHLPVAPRRGFVLVTEPLPELIRHKVYYADYVGDVASDSADLRSSPVVEGTRSGTVLVGATRERVGFDRGWSPTAVRTLAHGAAALFPFLAHVAALRIYRGFRPYCPDHLPVIGPDLRAPGLWHACGHEGAGIGLAAATGRLIAQSIAGTSLDLPLPPFRPDRFGPQSEEVR